MLGDRVRVLAACLVLLTLPCVRANLTLQQHQEQGLKSLQAGDFSAALEHFHAACEMAPKEYMNFMRRATAYRAQGRTKQAIKDYDTVLTLKPDFAQARGQRAELLLKHGEFEAARKDFAALAGTDAKAAGQVAAAEGGEAQFRNLQSLAAAGDHQRAIEVASQLVEIAPSSEHVRMLRGRAYEATGQHGEAIGDYTRAAKLSSGDTEPYVRMSELYFRMGERNDALAQVRECVKLDEEQKQCWALYRKLKKLTKALDDLQGHMDGRRYDMALEKIKEARGIEKHEAFYVTLLSTKECEALAQMGQAQQAIEACTRTLQLNERSTEALEQRAKAYEGLGDFTKAIDDLQRAVGIDEGNNHLKEQLNRMQKLQKNANKRDYYKILNVPRNAQEDVIQKAYRKLAREWHPDKFSDPQQKEIAAKKFMDIAAAKEVLTDPEKRRQFDSGEDPLDAEEQSQRQQQGFHGFQGFNPFQGFGGQQFHFKFN